MESTALVLRTARTVLRAVLLIAVAAYTLDVPGRLGWALYTEQYLALVIGLCTATVLVDDRGGRHGAAWRWIAATLAGIVLVLFGYVAAYYPSLQLSLVMAPPWAVALGILMVGAVLEGTRRAIGPFLPILVLVMMAFAFVGPHLPDTFQSRPVSFARLVVYLGLDTNALFGQVLAIAAIVVIPFIVFGFLLNAFGGSAFFSGLAARLVGRFKGGPAKVSVAGSAAFGMVSGSAVANVVAVGSVSIPMMSRAGYARHVAAAIEAVSSTGGQLMPPIMGAAAFLMAELLEVQYQTVVIAAILPALFFYVALFLAVDFEARRLDVGGATGATLDLGGDTRIRGWQFLLPVGVLLYLLFVENRTAEYAGSLSVGALILVYLMFPPRELWQRIRHLVDALLESMGPCADIILIGATAGLIIGVLNITGISFAITLQMLAVSQGSLFVMLILTAALSILLGLGMPTVGVYVLLATLTAPALVQLGIEPLAAHLYVLYFGMLSMITPPIAIASFAAASVANCDPWKTSFASIRVGAGVFLIPAAFVVQPELLFVGSLTDTAIAVLRLALAVALLTAASVGHAARPVGVALRVACGALALVNVAPFGTALPDAVLWAAFAAGLGILALVARPPRAADAAATSDARPS